MNRTKKVIYLVLYSAFVFLISSPAFALALQPRNNTKARVERQEPQDLSEFDFRYNVRKQDDGALALKWEVH